MGTLCISACKKNEVQTSPFLVINHYASRQTARVNFSGLLTLHLLNRAKVEKVSGKYGLNPMKYAPKWTSASSLSIELVKHGREPATLGQFQTEWKAGICRNLQVGEDDPINSRSIQHPVLRCNHSLEELKNITFEQLLRGGPSEQLPNNPSISRLARAHGGG